MQAILSFIYSRVPRAIQDPVSHLNVPPYRKTVHEPAPIGRAHHFFVDPPVLVLLPYLYVFLCASVELFSSPAFRVDDPSTFTGFALVTLDVHASAARPGARFNLSHRLVPQVVFRRTRDRQIEAELRGDQRE